jgi:hypothetical protein
LVVFYLPEESRDIERLVKLEGRDSLSAQQSVLGVSYEKIGIEIAKLWNFPQSLVESLRDWRECRKPANRVEKRRLVSAFADEVMENLISLDSKGERVLKALLRKYTKALNLSARSIKKLLLCSVDEFKEMAKVLASDISPLFVDQLTTASEKLQRQSQREPTETQPALQDGLSETQILDGADSVTDSFSTETAVIARTAASQEDPEMLLMDGLNEVTCMLMGEHSVSELFNVVLETMYRAVGFHRVVLALLDRKQGCMVGRLGFGEADERFINGFSFPTAYSVDLFHGALKNSVDLYIADATIEKIEADIPGWYKKISSAGSFLLLPLVIHKRPIGLIYADHIKPHGLNIDVKQLNLLKSLRNQILLAMR